MMAHQLKIGQRESRIWIGGESDSVCNSRKHLEEFGVVCSNAGGIVEIGKRAN